MKLLLVEDSDADLQLLQDALRANAAEGISEMRTALSMAEAEAALRAEAFDCVLIDLVLPDGSGLDNVRRLRAARAGQTVIVISGSEGEDLAVQALRHGAQDYLTKGEYAAKVVMRVIRRAIERNEQLRAVERQREDDFRRATRDTLTGVSNRRLLQQLAAHTIALSARQGWRFAVAFLDLNGFKPVNDTWGHACGDQLLRAVGRVLGTGVRDIDTVARVGGDEFLLLMAPPLELDQASVIVRRVQSLIAGIKHVDGHDVSVSASAGVAFYPDHGTTLEDLMACADQAMYRAKRQSSGEPVLYAPIAAPPARR
ncbi:MAG: diguanylate cyclase domain-containing protein [Nevskiaceae bacterium]